MLPSSWPYTASCNHVSYITAHERCDIKCAPLVSMHTWFIIAANDGRFAYSRTVPTDVFFLRAHLRRDEPHAHRVDLGKRDCHRARRGRADRAAAAARLGRRGGVAQRLDLLLSARAARRRWDARGVGQFVTQDTALGGAAYGGSQLAMEALVVAGLHKIWDRQKSCQL